MKTFIVWGLLMLMLVHASDQAVTVGYQSGFQGPSGSSSVAFSTVQHPAAAATATVATPISGVQVPGFIRYLDGSGVERLVSFQYPKPFYQQQVVEYHHGQGSVGAAAAAGGAGAGGVAGVGTYPVGSTHFYKGESPELIKAREEHFRTWALQQYHALRREIDLLRVQGKEPSPDMLEKYRPLERIATTVDYQSIANFPDVQRIRNEHLRLWNEAALKTLHQHSGPFTTTTTVINAPSPVVYQGTKSNFQNELNQQKLAHEAHLRVYNEQISLLKQLEAKRIQDLQQAFGVSSTVGVKQPASTSAAVQQLKNAFGQQQQQQQTVPVYVAAAGQQQPGFAVVGVHPESGSGAQVKANVFGVAPVTGFQKTVVNPFNVHKATSFPVQTVVSPVDVSHGSSAQFHHAQTVPVSGVSVYSADGVPGSHQHHQQQQFVVQSLVPQHSAVVGHQQPQQQVKFLVPTGNSPQQVSVVQHHQQQHPQQQQQQGQQHFQHQQKAFQVVVPSPSVGVGHQHHHPQAVTPAVPVVHRGVAVLKSLHPVGVQFQQQSHSQHHHQQQHHLNSLQDTPEVAHARAEHLRIYNEIKAHSSLQDQTKAASVLKDGNVQANAEQILEKFNEAERRRHEQQNLEAERIRESERIQEEKRQRERERMREAERLAEEQRHMETELWRLKEEEKNRQEAEKRNEFQQLRKQENEVRQQQQQSAGSHQHQHHFNTATVKSVGGAGGVGEHHHVVSGDAGDSGVFSFQKAFHKTGHQEGHQPVTVNAAGVDGSQHLRTTAGHHHVDGFQGQHHHQQTSGSSNTFFVVPLAGSEGGHQQSGGAVAVHSHRAVGKGGVQGSPSLTVVPAGGVVVTSTEHPGKVSTTLQDLEQATREHFRAHEVALEQLRLAALKDGGDQNQHQHDVNAKDCK